MTEGRSNPLVGGVKPTGDVTPARPDAAAGCGIASPATKWAAEIICEELVLVRIHWCPRFHRRRPRLMMATTWAAIGVRRGREKGL